MLTRSTYRILHIVLRVTCKLKFIPFDWDAKAKKISAIPAIVWRRSGPSTYAFLAVGFYTAFYTGFVIGSFIRVKMDKSSGPASYTLHLIWANLFMLVSILQLNNFKRRELIADFVNGFLRQMKMLEENYKSDDVDLRRDICEIAVTLFALATFTIPGAAFVFFWIQPTDPRYYSHYLIPYLNGWPPWVTAVCLMGFCGLAIMDAIIAWHIVLFNTLIMTVYAFSNMTWLKEISYGKNTYLTTKSVQNPTIAFWVFRSLQILNLSFNNAYSTLALPFGQFVILTHGILSNYVTIKMHSSIPMPAILFMPASSLASILFLVIVIPTGAVVHTRSTQFTKSWKVAPSQNRKESKLKNKFLRSTRALRFKMGSVFYLQKSTTFKLLAFYILYSLKTLIMFKAR